ncbi:hypothetical protein ACIA5D_17825 [Actinoplanes sp. NPDC051513]|uniref:hypothetical protein n=1 Tax=Actinoplanes sp. NPDC051513 TaxID=3363908 RepID=UPI0037AB3A95
MPIAETAEKNLTRRDFHSHSVEESDDGRWYVIDQQRLMSVTTAMKSIGKRGLVEKAASLSAEFAFDELPTLTAASRRKPCGNTWSRCRHEPGEFCDRCPCKVCRACVERWVADHHNREWARRADEGVRVHDVAEWWSYHREIKDHDDDIAGYVKSFQAYVADYGITPDDILLAEALLVHRDIGAAGQTDGAVRIHAERTEKAAKLVSRLTQVQWRQAQKRRLTLDVLFDIKTREDEEPRFFPENSLQLTGYRHFPVIRVKNSDHEVPMIPVDAGVIVQLLPHDYAVRPVVCDQATYEQGFLPALNLYRWLIEDGPAAVSSRTFVLPETVAARARKAAKEQAASSPATSIAA